MLRAKRLVRTAALLLPLVAAHGAPVLHLRPETVVTSHDVRMADLVETEGLPEVETRRLQAQVVGRAPQLDQVLEIRRGTVQRLLATSGTVGVLHGPAVLKVRRQAQTVEASALCQPAVAAVQERGRTLPATVTLDVRCGDGVLPARVGSGALEVRVRPEGLELLDGVQQVVVELAVDGRMERVVRVPIEVSLQAVQWCAAEAIASGEPVVEGRFQLCRRPIRSTEQLRAAGRALPAGRLKRALRAGEAVSIADVADPDMQLRGDTVTVMLHSGVLAIESRGELSRDARIGDTVRVQLRRGEWVEGRLAAAKLVEVEEQQ